MTNQIIEDGRAPLDLDLDSVSATTQSKPKLSKDEMDAAGVDAGFIKPVDKSDDDTAQAPKVTKASKKKTRAKKPRAERPWRRTGRTFTVNTNIKPESNDTLMSLVTLLSNREGRPVSKAEVLERAIDLLQAQETDTTPDSP